MSPESLLAEVIAKGVHLWAEGDELCLRAPKGALTPELRAALKSRKPDVVALLGQCRKHAVASYSQRRLWFFDQLEPNRSTYNMHLTYRLSGALDVVALEQSLDSIVRRHETLRTSFTAFADQPVQVITPDLPFRLAHCELEGGAGDEDACLRRQIDRYTRQPFTLSDAPLMRACLIRLRPDAHVLSIVLHHIIADGWSMRVLLHELADHYGAFAGGGEADIQPLPLQYADFARNQRAWLEYDLNTRLVYWREQLAGPPPPLMLPADRSRPAYQTFQGAREILELDPSLCASLRTLSACEGATLFMTLLAAFKVLLYRYTGQEDFVVGSPVAGRSRPGTEGMIGFFVNTVALRANLDGNPRFREFLRRTRETVLHAFEHEDLPFEKLVEELHPERDLSRTPLFQVLFNMINMGGDSLEMGDVHVERLYRREPESKFDLTMYVRPRGGAVRLMLVYNRDLFEKDTIAGMLQNLRALLESISMNADVPVALLPMAPPAQRPFALVLDTTRDTPLGLPLHRMVERQAAENPDRIAVHTRSHTWTYAELDRRAGAIASGLVAATAPGDARIGLLFSHGAPMVAAVLAALKAGKTYVPMDAGYPEARLRYMADDAQVQVILTTQDLLPRAEELACGRVPVYAVEAFGHEAAHPGVDTDPSTPAYILYTSGSTGTPKGVVQSHRNIQYFIRAYAQRLNITQDDRLSLLSSFGFDAAVMDVFGALLSGATLCPVDLKTETLPDALAWLADEGVTVFHSTPTVFRAFAGTVQDRACLTSIRTVVLGGEEVKRDDVGRFEKLFPANCQLVNLYGSAEASFSCCHVVKRGGEAVKATVPIGPAIEGADIRLLNAYGGEEPVFGEIAVRSPHVALGYWNRPDETESVFVSNGDHGEDRFYRTGDLGRRLSNGAIECLGRKDFQFKIRGYRVEPAEIETLLNQHPGVAESVVVAKETGDGDKRLVAYVVPGSAPAPDSTVLRALLGGTLPEYMVPAAFVTLDTLPRTATGKIDRRALPMPESFGASGVDYLAPRTLTEELLAGIWEQVLTRSRVSVQDRFFDLGGHSLMATQVVSRIRNTFGVDLPLRALFEEPTVAGLAQRIELLRSKDSEHPIPVLVPAPRDRRIPLSFAQQRLWLLDQLGARDGAYTMSSAIRLTGELEVSALEGAFTQLIARHESLRTVFVVEDEVPYQAICEPALVSLAPIEIDSIPEEDREAEAMRRASEEAAVPFDLTSGPLIRVRLFRLAPEQHVLSVLVHHIVSDAWSMGVLVRELQHFYEALVTGAEPALPALSIQYPDFAQWQRSWMQGDVLDAQLAYWREHLDGAPAALDLPTDRPRPRVRTFQGERVVRDVPVDLTERLRELSRSEGATLFMALFAAFNTLLSRYSGQTDVVVGSPIANRSQKDLEALIGFFVNTLAIRTDLSDNPTFRTLLRRVREVALGAYAHQDVPFERLVEALQPERDLSRSPIFQVMFVLQNAPKTEHRLPNLTLARLPLDTHRARFDVVMAINEVSGGLSVALEFNSDLFDTATMERMLGHYTTLLEAAAENADTTVAALPLLTEAERNTLLHEWNQTSIPFPMDRCVHELVEEHAVRTPNAIALVDDSESLTYHDVNQRANRLAHRLIEHGAGVESCVAIGTRRRIDSVIAALAVLKAGAAYLPLDPTYPPERLRFMLEDSGAGVLVTDRVLRDTLPSDAIAHLIVEDCFYDERLETANPAVPTRPENLAYVIYTSGTTGRPKGILIEHRGLLNLVHWHRSAFNVTNRDRASHIAGPAFDASVWELWPYLTAGATVHIPDDETRVSAERLRDWFVANEITLAFAPTPLAEMMIGLPWPKTCALRTLLTGGEALSVFPLQSLPFQLVNNYGPTENAVVTTTGAVTAPRHGNDLPSIGRPIHNAEVYVLDANLQPLPIGVPGELHVGGPGLAREYLKRPELTRERFIPHPFRDDNGARLYRTGDIVRFRGDGTLEFLGRNDSQVKLRGYRIELGEIENVLYDIPGVANAVVLLRNEPPFGPQLVAYAVWQKGYEPDLDTVRAGLARRLPSHMVPSAFVAIDALPLTANGKVDVAALPVPGSDAQAIDSDDEPRGLIEETIAGIWCSVLGVERIGRTRRFFDAGGHSLKATQVMSRLRDAFGVDLPLRTLFEAQTIAELAAHVESIQHEPQSAPDVIRPGHGGERPPLSFAQQRLWFLDQLGARDGVYTIATALHLYGELDEGALERALNQIVARHEVLRTRFGGSDSQPFQIVEDRCSMPLERTDLSEQSSREKSEEAARIVHDQSFEAFDLENGPLLRATLIRLADREHVFSLSMHHAISDGWSMGIVARELAAFYNAAVNNENALLPELAIQYADFAAWQREWLQGDNLRRQLDYWIEHLEGAPPVLELPTDRPRPSVQTFNGGRESLRIDAACCERLEALCRREDVTLFMTLCAAFNVLVHRYTGQDDFVLGTPIANRNRAEVENLIGFFANTLALRFRVDGEATFENLLNQVREVALGAFAHQDLPFEKLVEELAPKRSLAHSPLFQVMFALQNIDASLPVLRDLDVSRFGKSGGRSRFDLTLTVSRGSGGLAVNAEYNTDLFDAGTIQRLLRHYHVLLDAVTRDCAVPVSVLPMLTETERTTLLYEWNDTAVDLSLDRCVHQLVEDQAACRPGAVAVEDDSTRLTYGELNERANRLAHRLIELRVRPRSRVAVCTSRRVDMVVGILAVMKAGAAYVPLDPAYPVERLRYMVEDSSAVALVVDAAMDERMPVTEALHVRVEACLECDTLPVTNPAISVTAADAAYAIYTSGSTGRPKCVLIEHRGLLNLIQWHQRTFRVTANDRATHVAGPAFDASVWELWPYLTIGATVFIPDEITRVSAVHLRDWFLENEVTIAFLPTPLAELAIGLDWPATCSLRTLLTGGDTLHKRPSSALPFGLVNDYGPTENTVVSTSGPVEPLAETTRAPSLGRPIDNTEIYVLDRNLQLVPVGVPGELHVGGIGLAREYLGQPDLTSERFIPHPFCNADGRRLYKTGDMVRYRPDGTLEFLGRTDHQVKIRGYRVELGEIESALCRQPGVQDAVVLPRANGPGGPALAAFIVADSRHEIRVELLRDALKGELPVHMMPASLTLTDTIPLSAHGKVDRDALLQRERKPAEADPVKQAPVTETQRTIAAIWRDLLQMEDVGIHDNFLDSGGHSMLAVELLSRLNAAFNAELPLRAVFEEPTIAGLARRVDVTIVARGGRGNGHDPGGPTRIEDELIVPLRAGGSRTPIFLVAPAGGTVFAYYALAHHLGPDQPVYALQDPAFEGNRAPCDTIEEMATTYINAMRSVQPQGPYIMGGWSFGGTVAFEMARQLNGETGLLFLIETITGVSPSEGSRKSLSERTRLMRENFSARCLLALSGLTTTAEGAWFSLAATWPMRWLRAMRRKLGSREERRLGRNLENAVNESVSDMAGAGTMLVKQSFARHWVRIALANARAFRRYVPEPYPGRLTLFVAERRVTARPGADPARGWSQLAQGGVDVCTLPGDHFSILRNPNVATCAQVLRERADEAQSAKEERRIQETPTLAS